MSIRSILILLLGSMFAVQASAGNIVFKDQALKFRYLRFDGSRNLNCSHRLENAASQDWRIVCGEATPDRREYRVHLWVTLYARSFEPRNSYEILYWVTDFASDTNGGGTTWMHLKDASALHSLSLSQSLEKDTAGLYLDVDMSKNL